MCSRAGRPFAQVRRGVSLPGPGHSRHRHWRVWSAAVRREASPRPAVGVSPPGLAVALHDPLLRDALLMELLGATAEQVRATLDQTADWSRLDELLGRAADPGRSAPRTAVLARTARQAPPGARAPALAMLALAAWNEAMRRGPGCWSTWPPPTRANSRSPVWSERC